MLRKQTVLLFLLTIPSVFSSQVNKPPQITKWVVMQGGFLKVDGSTNINKFNCVVANYAKSDTVFIYKNSANELLYLSGSIKLDVQNFDCHNPVMTSDLRKTLKAREYPKLVIRFQNLSKYPNLDAKQDVIKGAVTIELAGVTKRFEVDYKIISIGKDAINLIGSRQLKFSDFNIIPPRKIGGMIQTNNELNVVFNLRMKVFD